MNKLSRHDIQKLEDYWINIEQYKKDLKYREWELLENHYTDTNIGGGKANKISTPTEQKAIILAEDVKYQNLKRIVTTIETMYANLDKDQKTIVDMRYWDKNKEAYEWQHIADELYMSVQRVLRKRNMLIDETARRLGWA